MKIVRTATTRGMKIHRASPFFHAHAHSGYSIGDALPSVKEMVTKVKAMGQPALALTDHGTMAGSVQLYTECAKAGIKAFPGVELYFTHDLDPKAKRYHLGLLALDTEGYEALVQITSKSNTRPNFNAKPRLCWEDFAQFAENGWTDHLALTTGCYFGLVLGTLNVSGPDVAAGVLWRLARLFPHTYVELQRHGIDQTPYTEDEVCAWLLSEADELGLPIIATQDSHYLEPEHRGIHDTLKRIHSFSDDPDDATFPGDGFHLSDEAWVRDHYAEQTWELACEGFRDLLNKHKVEIPDLDTYTYKIPKVATHPDTTLRERCLDALQMVSKAKNKDYQDRLESELEIVQDTGMASYLLLVATVTDYMRAHAVYFQARGSAGGSLICWLLGITQVDPIKYKLAFERFISRDRTKPPDVDLDIEDDRRKDVLAWLKTRFSVMQIGTYGRYSVDESEDRGSLVVAYKKIAKMMGATKDELDAIKGLKDIDPVIKAQLVELSKHKVPKSAGVHAGGLILTSNAEIMTRTVPSMLIASSETTCSVYNMHDVEALGLVKLDALGLRTMTTLRRTLELLGRDPKQGLDWIPMRDHMTYTSIRNRNTDGVFQLEGWTARQGCGEVKVEKLSDVIAIMAVYRPAVIDNGGKDLFLARRRGDQPIPKRHPLLHKHLDETYGLAIYQDQVVQILRELGMSPEDLTALLKAVKMSQADEIAKAALIIESHRVGVAQLATTAGFTDDDFVFLWDAIEGFAKYGFNRAHSTQYGITAYRCAYLKTHHPLEFHTALLETASLAGKKDKEELYLKSARNTGIRILRPDVNISGVTWSLDKDRRAIRKGLCTIHGVGQSAALEIASNAPYASIEDLIERTQPRKVTGGKGWAKEGMLNGVLGRLRDAGALGSVMGDGHALHRV